MERRITNRQVTFRKSFQLAGLEAFMPAGIYAVRSEEEMLDTLSFIGWRQIGTALELHREGALEYAAVDTRELRKALLRENDHSIESPTVARPTAPSVSKGIPPRPPR